MLDMKILTVCYGYAVAAQQSNANATGSGGSGSGSGANIPDIPIVTEPDYPERVPTVPSLAGSMFARNHAHGTSERSNKLAVAPLLDVSNSGADDGFLNSFFLNKNTHTNQKKLQANKTKIILSACVRMNWSIAHGIIQFIDSKSQYSEIQEYWPEH